MMDCHIWRRIRAGARGMPVIALAGVLAAVALVIIALAGGEAGSDNLTPLEERISRTLSRVEGAGKVQVLIGEGEEGGVLVVAQGAGDVAVALNLAQGVSSLLGVENSRIQVLKMEGEGP